MRWSRKRRWIVALLAVGSVPCCVLAAGCAEMTTANPLPPIEAGADAKGAEAGTPDAAGDAEAHVDADAAHLTLDAGDADDASDASDDASDSAAD